MKAALSIALSLAPLISASPIYTRDQLSASTRQAKRQAANNGYDPAADTFQINVSSFCTEEERAAIIEAVAESGYLANALLQTGTDPLYQEDLNKFMGPGVEGVVQQTLMQNIQREWDLHTGAIQANAYVYCGDDNGVLRFRDCAANVDAYTWDEGGDHYVVICENWYNNPSLGERLSTVAANPSMASDVSSLYNNRASIWLHETTHWGNTISQPRVLDYDDALNAGLSQPLMVYGPQEVENNAATNGARSNVKIADAYSILAMSNLLTQLYEIPEALDSGNATATAMDSAEPHMLANDYIQRRQTASPDTFTQISGSMAQLDTALYTAAGGSTLPIPNDQTSEQSTEQTTEDASTPAPSPVPVPEPNNLPPPVEETQPQTQTVQLTPVDGNVVVPQGGEPVSGNVVVNGVSTPAEGVIVGDTVVLNIDGQTYTGPIA